MKLFFWVFYGFTNDLARVGRLRFYRWWGRSGVALLLALLPAVLALWIIHVDAQDQAASRAQERARDQRIIEIQRHRAAHHVQAPSPKEGHATH